MQFKQKRVFILVCFIPYSIQWPVQVKSLVLYSIFPTIDIVTMSLAALGPPDKEQQQQ